MKWLIASREHVTGDNKQSKFSSVRGDGRCDGVKGSVGNERKLKHIWYIFVYWI